MPQVTLEAVSSGSCSTTAAVIKTAAVLYAAPTVSHYCAQQVARAVAQLVVMLQQLIQCYRLLVLQVLSHE
jgi:hypothetical protein